MDSHLMLMVTKGQWKIDIFWLLRHLAMRLTARVKNDDQLLSNIHLPTLNRKSQRFGEVSA